MVDKELTKGLAEKFGLEGQLQKLVEECAEFIVAHSKCRTSADNCIIHADPHLVQDMLDELADVTITLSTVHILSEPEIQLAIDCKSVKAKRYLGV